jgi:predicted methyltransferase
MTTARSDHLRSRRGLLAVGAATAVWPWPLQAQDFPEATLRAAVDGPARSPANRLRDGARHPFETLRFFGLLPQHQVIEIAPGAGWYTEILAPYLRERGRLYAAHYPADDALEGRRKSRHELPGQAGARRRRCTTASCSARCPRGPAFQDIAAPGGADAVLTFRNVHNWIEDGHLDETLRAFHAVLKPGGVLGVVDHRAPPGTTLERIKSSGYVTEALMQERAAAAGFTLHSRSEVNANPRDTHEHPNGVWSLPPTLRGGDVDRAKFLAIGESDRFTHRYVKT